MEHPIEPQREYSQCALEALPEAFVARCRQLLGDDADRHLERMGHDRPTAFRVNRLVASAEAAVQEVSDLGLSPKPLPSFDGVWTVPAADRQRLTDCDAARDGRIYLMTPSSVVPGLCLDPQPGEEVLDLAAAPGGKTLHLAERMDNTGRIAAVESVKDRFHRLRRNLERCGATNVDTYLTDGRGVWRKVPERFDRVLLDAPCSAEGRIDPRDPASWKYWSEKKVREMARKQRRLAESAVHCLKPGGRLVYCTCTLAPEENEAIIDRLLSRFGDALDLEDVPGEFAIPAREGVTQWGKSEYDARLALTRRILPQPPWEGFFIAVLRKTASTVPA